jgi:hypothetical protein
MVNVSKLKVVAVALDVIPAVTRFVVVTVFAAYRFPSPEYDTFAVAPAVPDEMRYTRLPGVPVGAGPVDP